jgi:hypothetical protein
MICKVWNLLESFNVHCRVLNKIYPDRQINADGEMAGRETRQYFGWMGGWGNKALSSEKLTGAGGFGNSCHRSIHVI